MPQSTLALPMSVDEFQAMEPRLGWKHEYWDQAARLSCQHSAVTNFELSLTKELSFRSREELVTRQAKRTDHQALFDLFLSAFDNAMEFTGWSEEHFLEEAKKSVCVLGGTEARTWVAEVRSEIVGTVIVRRRSRAWRLEPVMVSPDFRRLGVASTLLAAVARELRDQGIKTLRSKCHLGNAASMAWHRHGGFEERPSYSAANHRWRYYQLLERHHASHGRDEKAALAAASANEWRLRADERHEAEFAITRETDYGSVEHK